MFVGEVHARLGIGVRLEKGREGVGGERGEDYQSFCLNSSRWNFFMAREAAQKNGRREMMRIFDMEGIVAFECWLFRQ